MSAPTPVTIEDRRSSRSPELLAPAGDWECARAAVENGADAIYFGLERFNARMRAHNFTTADLPELMRFLHSRGVRGYVTFNTLVFADEMAAAEETLRAIIAAGVDAAIVQDVGICRLIRQLSPDFPIHASTQMTITSAAGVEFARALGCQLVVLARECSLKEIALLGRHAAGSETTAPLPVEVFVHGALCVAYSGQCLTSESLGGRSANRGECAQACRMPYELISDGERVPLGDRRYLLSPQDLSGLDVLPELVQTGVASLKIEGRLKSPEYVANVTRVYRKALDELAGGAARGPADAQARYDLQMAFSRGLYSGWFGGVNNQALVHGRFGTKRGVLLGEVQRVGPGGVALKLQAPLKPGDGVVFDAGRPDVPEEGGRVYEVIPRQASSAARGAGSEVEIRFGDGDIDFQRVQPGDRLWKTSDPELDRRVRQTYAGDKPRFQRPISVEVHGCFNRPLSVLARDESGAIVHVESAMPLAPATNQPLTTARLEEQLGRLGGTPFRLESLNNLLEGSVLVPVSELNRMRREFVRLLEERRQEGSRWTLHERAASLAPGVGPSARPSPTGEPELIVLVRSAEQLEAALRAGVRTLYCEYEDPKRYREAVQTVRAAGHVGPDTPTIWVAPPRVFKAGEEWILRQVLAAGADGYLVRNYDHLRFFAGQPCVGDFSLNIANGLAAAYFKTNFSLQRLTASYDLNIAQLEALLRSAPPAWFEITIHQHMPMFHMEHCVFCAFLSSGTDFTNCGRPCDQHRVKLRDRVGAEHVLKADAGCRNTVFNAVAQTGAEFIEPLRTLGVRSFRLEFVAEAPEQVTRTINRYRQVLRREMTGAALWRELKLFHQLGVTRGQMDRVG